jgi:hypothetical protein
VRGSAHASQLPRWIHKMNPSRDLCNRAVERYYQGDNSVGERPGYLMTEMERKASAADRSRMRVQSSADSNAQGGYLSWYSREMWGTFWP